MRWIGVVLSCAAAGNAFAGGPLSLAGSGGTTPVVYGNGGADIVLNFDRGPLGGRSNAQTDSLVNRAMFLWNDVASTSLALRQGADLPVDVTASNAGTYLSNFGDGLNPVVYDSDGSIIDALFGVGAKKSILGFAGSAYSSSTATYREGRAVINGYLSLSETRFVLVFAHELGHFFGLDHTQLDATQGLASGDYPVMYPIGRRTNESLHPDDIAAATSLYAQGDAGGFGELKGVFLDARSAPVLGANIWARSTTSGEVYSCVSDFRKQGSGHFRMLLPPGDYTLHAESIHTSFVGGSRVGPYSETSSDASFKAPHPISPVTFQGATSGSSEIISVASDCTAEVTFRLDGAGKLAGSACDSGTSTIIVDNRDVNTSRSGTWSKSTAADAWSSDSVYNDYGSSFRWIPAVPEAGAYEVYAWWTYHPNRSSNVPYRVRHSAGTSKVVVDQHDSSRAGRWVSLGTYNFAAGSGGYVEVSSENGQASADAIKLEVAEAVPVSPSIVVDNRSANTTRTGTWQVSSASGSWSTDSWYNDAGSTFRWIPDVPSSGNYNVYAWWTYHPNRSSSVPYRIRHGAGTSTVTVNQRDSSLGGQWISLGTHQFGAGSSGYVEVSSENGQASADAIKLEPTDAEPSPSEPAPADEVIMDNRSASTSRTGTWSVSSSSDPWSSDSLYNNGYNTFRWTPTLESSGTYEVYAWWTYHSNRSSKVPYRVRHAAGTATITVNQHDATKAGRWVLLGSFDLDAANAYVEVSSENGQACADAVRFVASP